MTAVKVGQQFYFVKFLLFGTEAGHQLLINEAIENIFH